MHKYAIIYLLQLWFSITSCVALGMDGEPGGSSINSASNAALESTKPASEFQLPDEFYVGKCDPCIPRAEYRIQVVVHGTQGDVYWEQAKQAMEQASRDTGVAIDMELMDGSLYTTPKEIHAQMASTIRRAISTTARNKEVRPDALIVTLPSAMVHQAVAQALQTQMPVFGFHSGYEVAEDLGVLGFVAQDDHRAGKMVARELMPLLLGVIEELANEDGQRFLQGTNETTLLESLNTNKKVLYVNHDRTDGALIARFQGLQAALRQDSQGSVTATQLYVDVSDVFDTVQTLNDEVFLDCPYDAVVLGGPSLVDIASSALVDSGCEEVTTLVSFGMSDAMIEAIVAGHVAFAAAPQHYIESVFVVVMASMFVTTGKKLSLPQDSSLYMSGPVMITLDNIPTDSIATCREQAFPVCDADGEPFGPMTTTSNSNKMLCNDYGCLPRQTIRIGGVLHGVMTDLFWDPVFAAAEQAAMDVGIDLELERMERQETNAIVFAKMAARIESLCQSGVDGIFVTIPDDTVLDAIRLCQSLSIPVVSVNAGADKSQELGLMHHVGQMEYSAGFGAGQRLGREGIKEAYCLNHQVGNTVLTERCKGFEDGLKQEHPEIVYRGMFGTADDNQVLHQQAVEGYVAEHSPNAGESWDHIGFMLAGAGQVENGLKLQEDHPNAVLGTFDLSENMFQPFEDGRLKFGVDQQPFLQGALPVFLLTYAAYTQQTLINAVIETGPRFVDSKPTADEEQCEATFYSICSILPEEDLNMIGPGLLAVGYLMVSITVLSAILCIGFVLYYWEKSVLVRISQPPFLITLCVGCIVSILSIIPMGAQTNYRYVKDHLSTGQLTDEVNDGIDLVDASCMMVPWLYSLGFVMVFSSLFGKIWRVQLIYKAGETFRRKRVTFMDIAPYTAIMFAVVLSLLIAWQIAAPFQWERDVVLSDSDGFALESLGMCTSDDGWWFWLAIMCFQVLCLFYALVLCFQTKHIQDELSESSNTFLSVVCIFQINVLAMPISAMVRDDTQVFYFVRACAVFLQNYSVLCLMFAPKIYRIFTDNDVLPDLARSVRNNSGRQRSSLRVSFGEMPARGSSQHMSSTFQASSAVPESKEFKLPRSSGMEPDSKGSVRFDESKKTEERAPTPPPVTAFCPRCALLQANPEAKQSDASSDNSDLEEVRFSREFVVPSSEEEGVPTKDNGRPGASNSVVSEEALDATEAESPAPDSAADQPEPEMEVATAQAPDPRKAPAANAARILVSMPLEQQPNNDDTNIPASPTVQACEP